MILIIEGGELVGKTSIVRALQDKIPYHTLVKLSGFPTSVVKNMETRCLISFEQYEAVKPLIEVFGNDYSDDLNRTLIFDRFSTTEKVMFRESFDHGMLWRIENCAVMHKAKQVILTAPNEVIMKRFNERRNTSSLEFQTLGAILEVNRKYIKEASESPISTVILSNDGSKTTDQIADEIIRIFDIPLYRIND